MKISSILRFAVKLDRAVSSAYERVAAAFLWFIQGPILKMNESMYKGYVKTIEHIFHTSGAIFRSLKRPN
ncbi:MAG: hypothetical protein IB616_05220 [Methanosarcinales archaeon]|jgi:hypothetical protein|nr:MAG: hypothetical protein IB616_05220 [Methanosarcinales archaeon]